MTTPVLSQLDLGGQSEKILFSLSTPYELFHQTKPHLICSGTFQPPAQDYVLKVNVRANNFGGAYAQFTFLAGLNGGAPATLLCTPNVQAGPVAASGVTDFRYVYAAELMFEQVVQDHYEWRLTGLTPGATYTWQLIGGMAGGAQSIATVGSNPYGMAISPDNRTLWVANNGDNSVIPITVGLRPNWQNAFGLCPPFSASGRPIPGFTAPQGIAVSPDGTKVAVVNTTPRTVTIINALTKQIIGTTPALAASGSVTFCAWTQDSTTVWAGCNGSMFSINTSLTSAPTVNGTSYLVRTAGDTLYGVICHPDGKTLWIANDTANIVYSAPLTSSTTLGAFTGTGTLPNATVLAIALATPMTYATVAAGTTLTSAAFNLTATNVFGHFAAGGGTILVPISGGYATITYQYALYSGTSVTFYNCTGGAGQATVAGTIILDQGVYIAGQGNDMWRSASPGTAAVKWQTWSIGLVTMWISNDNAEIWATSGSANSVEARQISDGQVIMAAVGMTKPTYTIVGSTDGYVYVSEYPTGMGSIYGWNSGLCTINPLLGVTTDELVVSGSNV